MNKICKEYIKEVKVLLPINRKTERTYVRKLQADVESYCEEVGVTEKQELYNNYGKPLEVVNNYLSARDAEYILKKIKYAKYFRIGAVTAIILLTIISALVCGFLYKDHQDIMNAEVVGVEYSINGKVVSTETDTEK